MDIIKVEHGVSGKLQKLFGVSAPTIRRALRGNLEGRLSEDKALRIRKAALENGGQILYTEK
ncbi:hypothetical protein [Dysgonomonas gadei]|uniref:Uncharacterized protein n=2 Tax=Dysgonomonas TaxID=156973 RepID=F5J197_9BACT|nr:hypothetical protein [Dysgonomonas gadei]EGK00471.1 hypothetical protein HMPREF9455_03114 [Dysgonomonas gadei ATCC BAA-286]SBV98467.1 conserved hypothetical protein [uncultured Dysgonomonas sp.]